MMMSFIVRESVWKNRRRGLYRRLAVCRGFRL